MSRTILIVDDDYMNRDLLQAHMEVAGFQVLQANNGKKALALAASQQPDLILMDVRMPGMTGIETCEQLKTQPDTAHIPVILITAYNDNETMRQAQAARADDVLLKPFDVHSMFAKITVLLSPQT
jgi:two-component system, cell cycle response regulator